MAAAGALIIVDDITHQKIVEDELRESEVRNASFLRAFPDLMFIHDREGVYLEYHASEATRFTADPDRFLEKSLSDVLPSEIADRFMQAFTEAQETGLAGVIEFDLDVPEGGTHFEARITRMDDRRQLTIVRDITERKRAEVERQKLEAQLQQARRLESVGTLAGGMRYCQILWIEFRTLRSLPMPLPVILRR